MDSYLIFDIETVPDIESGASILGLTNLSDEEVIKAMEHTKFQKTGNIIQPNHLQKIICISVIFKKFNEEPKLLSLGDENSKEKDLISYFFKSIDKYQPTLVSWNGKGFDMPVIHYRALKNSVVSEIYWEEGKSNWGNNSNTSSFRYNNYLNKFHNKHIDLMAKLSNFGPGAPLSDIAQMIGAPGKTGIDGSKVCNYYLEGKLNEIRNYCETDVLNTYLVFLKFLLISSEINFKMYKELVSEIIDLVKDSDKNHLQEFYSGCDISKLIEEQ